MGSTLGSIQAPIIDVNDEQMHRIAATSKVTVEELAEMIGGLPDTTTPIPRSEWTVGETGSHLAGHLREGTKNFLAFQGPLVESDTFANLSACVQFQVTDAFDFGVRFENGEVTIDPGTGLPADCHIEVDALHFFLVMIKMLTVREAVDLGRLKISGPNPELGYKFTDFFFVP